MADTMFVFICWLSANRWEVAGFPWPAHIVLSSSATTSPTACPGGWGRVHSCRAGHIVHITLHHASLFNYGRPRPTGRIQYIHYVSYSCIGSYHQTDHLKLLLSHWLQIYVINVQVGMKDALLKAASRLDSRQGGGGIWTQKLLLLGVNHPNR